jgi:small subunit ribosomal protein S1
MIEEKSKFTENLSQEELEQQYIKSLESIEEGQMLSGKVIQIVDESVFIDVGYKSEGKVPLSEFQQKPKIGDSVDVILLRMEGREGSIIVSKKRADEKLFWKNLRTAFAEKEPVEGTINNFVKGGYEVDLGFGIRGFLPLSKVDTSRVNDEDIDSFLKLKSKFFVERLYSNGRVNIVLSRRGWLEKENRRRRDEFFESVKIGDEVEGIAKTFTSFGAFIDLGGFDGLLHINDMSWGHVNSPKEVVELGQKLALKVIRIDAEENRINLSLKHFTEDPWSSFEEKYAIDDVVRGRVTKLTNFGAFIELEEGIEGLAHISELSWVRRVRHPKEVLKIGDEVDVKILEYDVPAGKVSLGLKQVLPNPWDDIETRYPEGMRIKRAVKNLSSFGAFIELEEGIDGLLHLDDFSWTKRPKNPEEVLNVGDEIEVMVIGIDKESRRIKLGLKQLSEDPWMSLQKAFPKGSVIEGEITSITDFGFFVKVQGDIEGLINKNNLFDPGTEELEKILGKYKEGERIKAVVTEINASKQRLSMSRKEFLKRENRVELARYIHDEDASETATIGDLLKDKSAE